MPVCSSIRSFFSKESLPRWEEMLPTHVAWLAPYRKAHHLKIPKSSCPIVDFILHGIFLLFLIGRELCLSLLVTRSTKLAWGLPDFFCTGVDICRCNQEEGLEVSAWSDGVFPRWAATAQVWIIYLKSECQLFSRLSTLPDTFPTVPTMAVCLFF